MLTKKTWLLIILLIIALIPRAATINYGTNVDEGVYWVEAKQIHDGLTMYRDVQFNKTPLVAWVALPFFWLDDTPIYPMRVTMLLFSLLGLFCIFKLTKQLFGEWAAFAALTFMALEPFSCVWAKYLHTSTWTPWFQAGVLWLLIQSLQEKNKRLLFVSGIVLGFYALSKQTAIYMLPLGLLAWILFSKELSIRNFLRDTLIWGGGAAVIFLPFIAYIFLSGTFPAFWHDTWTSHHKIASWFAHHTLAFRLNEWKSVVLLAPALWLLSIGSLYLFLTSKQWRALCFVWIWLLVEVGGNVIFFTHVWRHYFLGIMVPFAILSGVFLADAVSRISKWLKQNEESCTRSIIVSIVLIAVMMVPFWGKTDWFYPGITIEQERNLAQYVSRACRDEYILNLTNPSIYIWADKKIPPVYEGERITRIPYFMTLAGRGYCTRDDIERTVEMWQEMDISCVVSFNRYISQLQENPVLEPLWDWLSNNFEKRTVPVSPKYGHVWLFEKKQSTE